MAQTPQVAPVGVAAARSETDDALRPWLRLHRVPGIGSMRCKRLVDRFGSPRHVLEAPVADLAAVEGVSLRLARAIKRQAGLGGDMETRELDRIRRIGCRVVTLNDANYPALLKEIPDPPPLLYVKGDIRADAANIALVGSRNATAYGIAATTRLSRDLAGFGMTVVSGMALGIDSAAHQGALAGGGRTVAVLGCGIDRIYPRENDALYHRIALKGAVISEFPIGAPPEAHHFPLRNRIISGMSLGTVVVEATRKSGSLITARLAAEQNREVFAVPGNIHSFKSTGTHTLIKQGAKLVERALDIVEEFTAVLQAAPAPDRMPAACAPCKEPPVAADEETVLKQLDCYPTHIDDLARRLGMTAGRLAALLLQLELKGLIQQLPGKRFCLKNGG